MAQLSGIVIIADGTEDIEAVTPIDLLRRGGVTVTVASVSQKTVTCSNGTRIEADLLLTEVNHTPDILVIPGGHKGSENIAASQKAREMIREQVKQKKLLGSICAAPALVLAPLGVLNHARATCYPGYETAFHSSTQYIRDKVVKDNSIITGRGPGCAFEFSLALIEYLCGSEKSQEIAQKTQFNP